MGNFFLFVNSTLTNLSHDDNNYAEKLKTFRFPINLMKTFESNAFLQSKLHNKV